MLILDGMFNRQVKSLSLSTLTEIALKERPDRSGSITFGPGTSANSWFGRTAWSGMNNNRQAPSFDMIADARKVYALIREAQQSNRARAAT